MCDGNEASANLREKLERARRLLEQMPAEAEVAQNLEAYTVDLESPLRSLEPK